MLADLFSLFGLGLTAAGAGIAARSIILREDDAIDIGLARFAGETREENLALPAVKNLLQASKGARFGLILVVCGTLMQMIPLAARIFS